MASDPQALSHIQSPTVGKRPDQAAQGGDNAPVDALEWRWLHFAAAIGAVGATVFVAWIPLMSQPFWLDETGTWWFARSSLLDSISRATRFQAGSFLFHVIEWPFGAIFGRNEIALRMPSLLSSLAATALIYRLGGRLFDRGTGAIAAVAFVSMTWTTVEATDARPYALAIATLIAAALMLTRWFDTGSRRDAVTYVLLVTATIYLHYFIAIGLLAHLWYAAERAEGEPAVSARQLGGAYAAVALLSVPLVANLVAVVGKREALSAPDLQSAPEIISSLLPSRPLLLGALLIVLAATVWGHRSFRGISVRSGTLTFLIAWVLIPPITLTSISTFTGLNVTAERYFTSILPAVALLIAATIRGIGAIWPQIVVVAMLAGASVTMRDLPPFRDEDWQAAAAITRSAVTSPDTPVLLHSGFIEAKQIDWLTHPERAHYLNAPASMYPFGGRVIAMPFQLDSESAVYLEHLVTTELADSSEFLLVSRGGDPFTGWFNQRLLSRDMTSTVLSDLSSQILIIRFARV